MKILITGCAGFIGSHLSRHLLKNPQYEVHGLDDLSGGYIDNNPPELKFHNVGLTCDQAVNILFKKEKFDVVFHLAAYAAEGLSRYIMRYNCNNNIMASMNVINSCVNTGVKKIIYSSSMAVYGNQMVPYTEDMIPQPDDPYGASKYFVEMILEQTHEHFGLKYSVVRPHNVIGIYQNIWDKYRNVIGIWIRQALNKQPITVFGDGEQTRAFSDVKFYMQPFEKLMYDHQGETFNLGADKAYSLNLIAKILSAILDKHEIQATIEHKEARNEVKHAYCDHSKAKDILGFKDETDITATIEEMILWAKEQPQREVKNFIYEIEKNMYSYWKEN